MNQLAKIALAIFLVVMAVPATAANEAAANCPNVKKWQDALNKGDAAAVANLYTPDATEVTPTGIRVGQAAVEQRIEDGIKQGWKNAVITTTICNIEGPIRISAGGWTNHTPQGSARGFWTGIEKKLHNTWKLVNLTFNMTPPPLAK